MAEGTLPTVLGTPPRPGRSRLRRESSADQVAAQIRHWIISGQLRQGDRLRQDEIADELGVSRIPVREAIIALEVQGLVEVRVGSGAYVKRLPGKEDIPGFNVTAFELTEARLLFESEAAALAASQISGVRTMSPKS